MGNDYYNKEEQITFKQIILRHYERILVISSQEFTGGYWNDIGSNPTNHVYIGDKRAEYYQSVEMLANALYPYFDETTKKALKEYEEEKDKKIKEFNDNKDEENYDRKKLNLSKEKLILAKKLFRELSCLMYRLNYLKSETFSEGQAVEEDEGGEE